MGLSCTAPDTLLYRTAMTYPIQLLLRYFGGYTVPDSFLHLLRFQLHSTRTTPYCKAYSSGIPYPAKIHIAASHQGVSAVESVSDNPLKHSYTIPECIGYISVSISKQTTFVSDSQWNVYRIARHRATEGPIWHMAI